MLRYQIPIDEASQKPQRFIVNVQATLKDLLQQEDTDRNHQITIDDNGPKVSVSRHLSYLHRLNGTFRSYP
jgi:neutral trehalase